METGESIRVVSGAGWNSISLPDSRCDGERGAVAPGVRDAQGGLVLEVVGCGALRIEQQLVPIEDGQFAGGGAARGEALGFGRGE